MRRVRAAAAAAPADEASASSAEDSGADSELEALQREAEERALRSGVAVYGQRGVNNEAALRERCAQLQLRTRDGRAVDWSETLCVVGAPVAVANVDDDRERELAFYNMTLGAVKQGVRLLEERGVSWRRPDGSRKGEPPFLAEMIKSDAQMTRVKDQLLFEKRKIEKFEERVKQANLKKYGRQIHSEVKQRRDKQKREELDKIKSLRKNRKNVDGEADFETQLAQASASSSAAAAEGGSRKRAQSFDKESSGKRVKSKKRAYKDDKYGFGGKKRLLKQNDATSAADPSGFSMKRMKSGTLRDFTAPGGGRKFGAGPAGKPKGAAKGGAKASFRPGKARRQQGAGAGRGRARK